MRDLNYQLKQLCHRNRDGSFATQHTRERTLALVANQLHDLGYRHMSTHSLKPKHIEVLVRHWQDQTLSVQTIKARMAALRWWAQKVNRASVVARSNDHYGIAKRQFVATVSKARSVTEADLTRVRDEYVRMSLELQQAFGLRKEEAIKFQPSYADRGDHLVLKGSWTKGGKPRVIPVRNEVQRALLDRARRLAGRGSLIPSSRNYRKQLSIYNWYIRVAGLLKMHGLRHRYAQQRYHELTGWPAPVQGGPSAKTLTKEQKTLDRQARLIVSRELGHEREEITAVYLGR